MGGAERRSRITFECNRIHTDDVFGTGRPSTLQCVHPDTADSDDEDRAPGSVPAASVADPHPVVTPQDTSAAACIGIASSILITDFSDVTRYSANVPS